MQRIRDDGSPRARLVLIGESGGQEEEKRLLPFVGPSGFRLEGWWAKFGLSRADFYITNVYPYRPPNNRIEAVPREELSQAVEELHDRLAELEDPWLIVPTGNIALRALMGRPLWGKDAPKISDWRGSILCYTDRRGREVKVIPTLHPAFTFREPGAERACLHDWRRVSKDRHFRELRLPDRNHEINPSITDVEEYVDRILADQDDWLAFDIETSPRGGNHITCIGFSSDPKHSFAIPTTDSYWFGRAELSYVWELVTALLHGKNPKVTQNGNYDYYWLNRLEGIRPVRWHFDSLAMHHCLDATDDHNLGYLASVYTRQPYWKKMVREMEAGFAGDDATLYRYNGIDCCVTLELAYRFAKKLEKRGLTEFYVKHYRELQRPAIELMLHGIRVDDDARRWWHFGLQAERIEIQDKLAGIAGQPLHAAKSLSTVKLKKFLYDRNEGLGLPVQKDRKTKSETTGEVAIRKLMQWTHSTAARSYKRIGLDQVREILNCILEERRKDKLVSFLNPTVIDPDGILRATFKLTTETGRFASAKNPMRTGLNLQNQDREIRRTFVPDV